MMKQKLLAISTAALIGFSSVPSYGFALIGDILPTLKAAGNSIGLATIGHTTHIFPLCVLAPPGGPLCANVTDIPYVSMWLDWLLAGVTALDYAASLSQGERTIDASDAIKKLEKALEGGSGGGSCGGGSTSGDASMATVYTADMILAQIEVSKGNAGTVFENTRDAVKEYLFETPSPDIKGECTQSDKDCAEQRQGEWLLASVALASATADKVLDQTAKQNVQDGQTQAEKPEEEQGKGDTETTGGGATTLTAHFKELASNFNAQTSPTGLYNRMADIVLDTHRQINDANALMGRDLEAQGLRVVVESGPVLLTEETETEE